uniref:Uncharacterized protein n=1 Tax=Rhizophora mucronata TaxID=61149 RepID=A0A2P2QY16_RHIMU
MEKYPNGPKSISNTLGSTKQF